MKNKKSLILIIITILIVALGISYAIFNYQKIGTKNGKLIVGDIWMKYEESNQLVLEDVMPMDILDKVSSYKVNPVMKEQGKNELTKCVNYLISEWGLEEVGNNIDEGETYEAFCKGTGTNWDSTFQEYLDYDEWYDYQLEYFINNNIIIENENGDYILNPVTVNQVLKERTELDKCVSYLEENEYVLQDNYGIAEGGTIEGFCKDLAKTNYGQTISKWLNDGTLDEEAIEYFKQNNIIRKSEYYDSYEINPIVLSQGRSEHGVNELTKCTIFVKELNWINLVSPKEFCKNNEMVDRKTFGDLVLQNHFGIVARDYLYATNIALPMLYPAANPIVLTQELEYKDELSACVEFFYDYDFDGGGDADSFCQGVATYEGLTIQEYIEDWSRDKEYFLQYGGQELIDTGVISPQVINLPYFEFEISGKNTYTKKDIWYEILLNHGDEHDERTTRISDDLLRFRLVELDDKYNEIEIFNDRRYSDIENKQIWVDTISKDTKGKYNKIYRLYAWISNDVVIGNSDQDYTLEEWEDIFASIKVNVKGDFKEKELVYKYEDRYDETDESCFEYKIFFELNNNLSSNELSACVNYLISEWGEEEVGYNINEGESYESFCKGAGTLWGETFQSRIDDGWWYDYQLEYFFENNIIIDKVSIINYNESCGSDVVIPKKINGLTVSYIGENSFKEKGLTTVAIPNTVVSIEDYAFAGNSIYDLIFEENSKLEYIYYGAFEWNILTKIKIPASVKRIENRAFVDNYFTSIVFEENSKLEYIGHAAFQKEWYYFYMDVTIPETVIYLSCTAFNNSITVNKSDSLVCTMPTA